MATEDISNQEHETKSLYELDYEIDELEHKLKVLVPIAAALKAELGDAYDDPKKHVYEPSPEEVRAGLRREFATSIMVLGLECMEDRADEIKANAISSLLTLYDKPIDKDLAELFLSLAMQAGQLCSGVRRRIN